MLLTTLRNTFTQASERKTWDTGVLVFRSFAFSFGITPKLIPFAIFVTFALTQTFAILVTFHVVKAFSTLEMCSILGTPGTKSHLQSRWDELQTKVGSSSSWSHLSLAAVAIVAVPYWVTKSPNSLVLLCHCHQSAASMSCLKIGICVAVKTSFTESHLATLVRSHLWSVAHRWDHPGRAFFGQVCS